VCTLDGSLPRKEALVRRHLALPVAWLWLAVLPAPERQVHDQIPPTLPTVEDPRLVEVASSTRVINGVTTTPDEPRT
jgi:hypothetical protein